MNKTNVSANFDWEWIPLTWEWWVIVQLVLSVIGIIGNILVIIVVINRGKTRFATDVLIGNLAFADFLTSLLMIPRPRSDLVPDNWKGMLYCRIEYSNVFMWISTVASVFILTVISVERLVAVKYPLKFKMIFTAKRSRRLVSFSWIGATVLNVNTLAISAHDIENHVCKTELLAHVVHMTIGVLLFMFKYLMPIAIMIGSYVKIIQILRSEARNFQPDGRTAFHPARQISKTMRRMTRTVLIVVIVFIICWSPDQICFFLFNLKLYPTYLYSDIYRVLVCLGFVNSCSNPLIYSVRNKKFRTELSHFLCISPSDSKLPSQVNRSVVKSGGIKLISGQVPK
ncbi:nociceptin receptor-like [Lytechinus variegatus]|uniref:nociceptin receptor-like n=1 Tax=Lytechinus variegatus TaxID=7654 RepID=UPI001BB171F9|nr:nociceptin receptor-like [Lytechinus variegatus]